jgi:flagellar motor switch protein FliN
MDLDAGEDGGQSLSLEPDDAAVQAIELGMDAEEPSMQADETFEAVPDLNLDALENDEISLGAVGGAAGDDISLDLEFHPEVETGDEPFFAVPAQEVDEHDLASLVQPEASPFTAAPDVHLGAEEVLELNLRDLDESPGDAMKGAGLPLAKQAGREPSARSVGIDRELLLSIPRKVNVEMGSVSLNGQEILQLSYGSIVQLDRMVGEPVDLVLEGRHIAQGEIVLINGKNLGVRILSLHT